MPEDFRRTDTQAQAMVDVAIAATRLSGAQPHPADRELLWKLATGELTFEEYRAAGLATFATRRGDGRPSPEKTRNPETVRDT